MNSWYDLLYIKNYFLKLAKDRFSPCSSLLDSPTSTSSVMGQCLPLLLYIPQGAELIPLGNT